MKAFLPYLYCSILAASLGLPHLKSQSFSLSTHFVPHNQPSGTLVGVLNYPGGTEPTINPLTVGSELWRFTENGEFTFPPAIRADGRLFTASFQGDQKVYALNSSDGSISWEYLVGADVWSTPMLGASDRLFITSDDGKLTCLSANTGVREWEFVADSAILSSPAVGQNGVVYIASDLETLFAINSQTGQEIWQLTDAGGEFSSPVISPSGTVFIGSINGLTAVNGTTGSVLWNFEDGGVVNATPAIGANGLVYFGTDSNSVYAFDTKTGQQIWEFTTGNVVESTPAIGEDGTVYVGSNDGKLYALDGETGSKIWEFSTGGPISRSVAVGSDNTVFAGSFDNNLYALSGETGDELWSFSTGGSIEGGPVISSDGVVYLPSQDQNLYAIQGSSLPANSNWPMFGGQNFNNRSCCSYTLVSGAGSSHNALFQLQGNRLEIAHSLDIVNRTDFLIRIRGNNDGNITEQALTIQLQAFAPTSITLSSNSIVEQSAEGTLIGTLTASDPDVGDSHTFTLDDSGVYPDNVGFKIQGNQLQSNHIFDFATKSIWNLQVVATDSYGQTYSQALTVEIVQDPGDPSDIKIDSNLVPDNTPAGYIVGNLSILDPSSPVIDPGQIGQKLWEFTTGGSVSGSPSLGPDGTIYILAEDSTLYALDGRNGTVKWQTNNETNATYPPAIASDGTVFLTVDGGLIQALNGSTGTTLWTSDSLGAVYSSPAVDANNTLYVGADDFSINAFNATTGDFLWFIPTFGDVTSTPAIGNNNTIYVGSQDHNLYGIDVQAEDLIWTFQTGGPIVSSPALSGDGVVYVGSTDNKVYAINTTTGAPLWEFTTGGTVTASPVIGLDGSIFIGSSDSKMYALDGQTGTKLWEFSTGGTISGSAVVGKDGVIYFGSEDSKMYALNSEDGGQVWEFQTGGPITSSPVLGPNAEVIFGSGDNKVYALQGSALLAKTSWPTIGGTAQRDGHSYQTRFTLVSGQGDNDNDLFRIDGNQLKLDFPVYLLGRERYTVRVQAVASDGTTLEDTVTLIQEIDNQPPTNIFLSSNTVAENLPGGTIIGILSTLDEDQGDTHTYQFNDYLNYPANGLFDIDGNTIETVLPLNFESISEYEVSIEVTDNGGLTHTEILTIQITDANDPPSGYTLANTTIQENQAIGTVVGNLVANDPDAVDAHTFTFVQNDTYPDNAMFTIDGGELKSAASFDFETKSTYSICIQVSDIGGLYFSKNLTVTILDINDAPTGYSLDSAQVEENLPILSQVGILSAEDQDAADTFSYFLVQEDIYPDNLAFTLNGNQLLTGQSFNFEAKDEYSICIEVRDSGGLTFSQNITISITDGNDAPVAYLLDVNSIAENQPINTTVGRLSGVDPDVGNTFTYALVNNGLYPDNSRFTIDGNELKTGTIFNFETKSAYTICIEVTDNHGATYNQSTTITIGDINDPPTGYTLSSLTVPENAPIGTTIGTIIVNDPDAVDNFTFALVQIDIYPDNAAFTFDGNDLITTRIFNFENKASYTICLQVTDSGGLIFSQNRTIQVLDQNDAPTGYFIDSSSVPENEPAGTLVGNLTTSDPDALDSHTYSLVDPVLYPDNAGFVIEANQLKTAQIFKFASKPLHSICIETRDASGLTYRNNQIIQITNVVEAPTAITMDNQTILENEPSGTTVGNLTAIDPDIGDLHVFSLINPSSYPDNAAFFIDGSELKTSQVFDFETKNSYTICLQTTDAVGLTYVRNLIITVGDRNEAPTVLTLSQNSVDETAVPGTSIGTFATQDPDAGDSHTYAFINNGTFPGNAAFDIDSGVLKTAQAIDFETVVTYTISVQVTDNQGLSFDKTFSVTVEDVNEHPTAILIDNAALFENGPADELVGNLSVLDEDLGSTHTLELLPPDQQSDNAAFTLEGNQLKVVAPLDFETQSNFEVLIQATDNGGLVYSQTLNIQVLDVNEAPEGVSMDDSQINENQPPGSIVGNLQESPPDSGDTHTFALVNPIQYPDNSLFFIAGSSLIANVAFDFETRASYTICVEVTDGGGSKAEGPLTIEVVNLNETPLSLILDNDILSENLPQDTVVGNFLTIDTDSGDTFSYALVDSVNYPDNAKFGISGNQLIASPLNFEAQNEHTILVQVTDSGGLSLAREFVIGVSDASEPPTDITMDSYTIGETSPFGALVGNLFHGDPDAGDTHTFTLINSGLFPDNNAFLIDNNRLLSNHDYDYETKKVYTLSMQVSDSTGNQISKTLRIHIADDNEVPDGLEVDNTSIPESTAPHTIIANLAALDQDQVDAHTFTLTSVLDNPDNSPFYIQGNALFVNQSFDFETKNTYQLVIEVTDLFGLVRKQPVTITITDSEEPPVGIKITDNQIAMNQPEGTVIAKLDLIDPDLNPPPPGTFPPPIYNFIAGPGSEDNLLFRIENDELKIGDPESLLHRSTFSVRVQANTHEGVVLKERFTLTTRPFAPTDISLSKNIIQENEPIGTSIGSFSAVDRDYEDPHSYTLTNSVKYPDNYAFYIDKEQLKANISFNFEEQSEYKIYVQSTDSFGLTYGEPLTIHVFNQNEHATDMYMDQQSVLQFDPEGTVVGHLLFNDPDTEFSPQVAGQEGAVFWKKNTGGPVNSSPAIGLNGYIYAGSSDTYVYALNDDNGNSYWRYKTGGAVVGSPAIGQDNTVYIGSWDHKVHAIHGFAGVKKWTYTTQDRISSTPAIGVDGTVYIGSSDHHLYALNGANGALKWKFATKGDITGAPAIGPDGKLYFGSHDRKFYALDMETGELAWEFETGGWVRSTPSLGADGKVYFGSDDNVLYALNSQTGVEIWRFTTGYHVAASPIITDMGIVYVASSDYKVYALDEVTGLKRWEFATGDSLLATPLISGDGTLYVASRDGNLYALDGLNGTLLWDVAADGTITSSPVIDSNGTIYFGTQTGTIYAIGGNSGSTDFAWPMKGGNAQRTGRNFSEFILVNGSGDKDNRHFTIDGNELQLRETLDHLGKSQFSVRIRGVASSGVSFEKSFAIKQVKQGASPLSIHASVLTETGWMRLDWLGVFLDKSDGWIFHETLGWLFTDSERDSVGFWLWDEALGWLWTDETVYPHLYRYNHGWITYLEGSRTPRYFYDWNAFEWQEW